MYQRKARGSNLMDYEQLLGEFLSEYPEYNECIRYQNGVPFVGWTGLHVFLLWLRHNNHISDVMLARGDVHPSRPEAMLVI